MDFVVTGAWYGNIYPHQNRIDHRFIRSDDTYGKKQNKDYLWRQRCIALGTLSEHVVNGILKWVTSARYFVPCDYID
jgi:hypothetical protein